MQHAASVRQIGKQDVITTQALPVSHDIDQLTSVKTTEQLAEQRAQQRAQQAAVDAADVVPADDAFDSDINADDDSDSDI